MIKIWGFTNQKEVLPTLPKLCLSLPPLCFPFPHSSPLLPLPPSHTDDFPLPLKISKEFLGKDTKLNIAFTVSQMFCNRYLSQTECSVYVLGTKKVEKS